MNPGRSEGSGCDNGMQCAGDMYMYLLHKWMFWTVCRYLVFHTWCVLYRWGNSCVKVSAVVIVENQRYLLCRYEYNKLAFSASKGAYQVLDVHVR